MSSQKADSGRSKRKPVNTEKSRMIRYININSETLSIDDRRDILNMIINTTPDNKIHTKGDGTQVHYKDLSDECIASIYNFITKRVAAYNEEDISDVEQ